MKKMPKPKTRSAARLKLGQIYHTHKRYLFWRFGGINFAKIDDFEPKWQHFTHKTPLIRNLKHADMQLQHNKIINLKIAVAKIDGMVLRPSRTFSFWKAIGRPTKAKGYLPGMVLQKGRVKAGTGGGLCQLSNLIYWMSLHTPLDITERHRHGYDVFPDADRTQPFGSGATCFYNYGDLMIKNNTTQTFQLKLHVGEKYLQGEWASDAPPLYRYEVYEKSHLIQSQYWGGYSRHNLIHRRKYDLHDNLIMDDFISENHAMMMYNPLIATRDAAEEI